MLVEFKKEIKRQKESAMEDFLTKASNARAFYNYAAIEINRIQRYNKPLTIIYMDIDDFKKVNDTMGHLEGDRLVITVANIVRSNIRRTDALARLGGDEFVILLPEMGADSVQPFLKHLGEIIREEMKKSGYPLTFSAGVLTLTKPPKSIDEMIKAADSLMYEAKNHGKNNIRFGVYG